MQYEIEPLFFGWIVFVFGVPPPRASRLAQTLDQNRAGMYSCHQPLHPVCFKPYTHFGS